MKHPSEFGITKEMWDRYSRPRTPEQAEQYARRRKMFDGIVDGLVQDGFFESKRTQQPSLDEVLNEVREDSWKGKGPGRYRLPKVRFLHVTKQGGSLPLLSVNGKGVGYLHGGSDDTASILADMLNRQGNRPADLEIKGHYGNTVFYIDRIGVDSSL